MWNCRLLYPLRKTGLNFLIKLDIQLAFNTEIVFYELITEENFYFADTHKINIQSNFIYDCQNLGIFQMNFSR